MIPFLDLQKINLRQHTAIGEAMQRVLTSGWYLLGAEEKAFGEEYARYCGSKHCIGVANGLDALRIILRAWMELGLMHEGDEVIVPANTYIASLLAVTENRLRVVPVEPDETTFNIDPLRIESHITTRTRAVMIVHLYGRCAYTAGIADLCRRRGLLLLEDNAQAAGSGFGDRRTGSLGDAAGHSFYPAKNLGALGDGGAVTTDDDRLAETVRQIANYGSEKKYVNRYRGLNSRLDELQAAVLRVKLPLLDADNEHRRMVARIYSQNIRHPEVVLPADESACGDPSHVWHIYAIRCRERDRLRDHLEQNGVQTLIHYPIPPHRQQAYHGILDHHNLPVTERIHREVLSLPISPVTSPIDAQYIANIINKFQ